MDSRFWGQRGRRPDPSPRVRTRASGYCQQACQTGTAPDAHTRLQNPRLISVGAAAQARTHSTLRWGRGLWRTLCHTRGTYVRIGRPLVVTFPGADVCSARAREDSFARIFCCGSKISKTKTTTAQKTSVEPPQESKGLLAARLRSVREPKDTSFGVSRSVRGLRSKKQVRACNIQARGKRPAAASLSDAPRAPSSAV